MESRFGLKDLVLLVLTFAVGAAVIFNMVQEDRRWREMRDLKESIARQESILSDIRQSLLQQPRTQQTTPPPHSAATPDESWARPGTPITWAKPWSYTTDPTSQPGFTTGGTLTELFEGAPQKLTPYVYLDTFSVRVVNETICEPLAMYDSKTLDLRGVLAEAWQIDPLGTWIRVKLRDEATFSDGKPVTAEDVRYTFEEIILNPAVQADAYRGTVSITEVNTISPKVVEFIFTEPHFNNITTALRNSILPAHFYKQFSPDELNQSTAIVMGSGPYRLERMDPADQWKSPQPITLVRNESYWGTKPPIDRLRFLIVPDANARLTMFENGEADIIRPTPQQYRAKSTDTAFTQRFHSLSWMNFRSGYSFIAWNCGNRNGQKSPFADARVRRAMTMLLDRDRINRDINDGIGVPIHGPFPPGQSNNSLNPWPADFEAARALLRAAGWYDRNGDGLIEDENGRNLTFDFTYPTVSPTGEAIGTYLADQGAKVGIRVTPQPLDWTAFQGMRKARDFDAFLMGLSWANPESDPYQSFHSSQIATGDNWSQFSHPEVDTLIELGRKTIDAKARQSVWHQVDEKIHEQQPYTFLYGNPWLRFVSHRVRNVNTYPAGLDRREFFIAAGSR